MSGNWAGILALLMWSIMSPFLEWSIRIPPFQLAAFSCFLGAVLLTGWQYRGREGIRSYWSQPLSHYAFWLFGVGLYTILFYIAVKMAPVFEIVILNYLWPVFLVILSIALHNQKASVLQITSILLGLFGMFFMMLPDVVSGGVFSDLNWGHVIIVIAALIWSLYSVFSHKFDYPVGFLAPAFFVFSLICFGLHLVYEETVIPNGLEWFAIIMLGSFRVSYLFWDYAMKHGDVMFLSSLSYGLPLSSALILFLFGMGTDRPYVLAGSVLVILGCGLAGFHKHRSSRLS